MKEISIAAFIILLCTTISTVLGNSFGGFLVGIILAITILKRMNNKASTASQSK